MIIKSLLTLLFFLFQFTILAQGKQFSVGLETGTYFNSYVSGYKWDSDSKIEGGLPYNFGLKIQRDFHIPLRFSTGFLYRQESYLETGKIYSPTSSDFIVKTVPIQRNMWILPFELRVLIQRKNKLRFAPGIGLTFNRQFNATLLDPSYYPKDFSLDVSGRIGIEYQINEKYKIQVDPSFHIQTFTGYNKNNYFGCSFGAYYILSNHNLTEEKIKQRIERDSIKKANQPFLNNSIYFSLGYGGLWVDGSVSYETLFLEKMNRRHTAFLAKIKVGGFITWGDEATYLGISGGYLIGNSNNFFEITGGGFRTFDKDFYPAASVGYRRQKNNFQFRTGIGLPETLYFGFGVAF
jgi:hypothetical protein